MSKQMDISQLEALLDNPNARKMLDYIAHAEGTARHKDSYSVGFGHTKLPHLNAHPGSSLRRSFTQTDGKVNTSTAAGRYQFMPKTWAGVQKQLGLTDFSPRQQDLGALQLIKQRGALKHVLDGDFGKAIGKLGPEWASLPSGIYKQNKRQWDHAQKFFGGNMPVQDTPQPGVPNPIDVAAQEAAQNQEQQQMVASAQPPGIDMGKVLSMDALNALNALGVGYDKNIAEKLQYMAHVPKPEELPNGQQTA